MRKKGTGQGKAPEAEKDQKPTEEAVVKEEVQEVATEEVETEAPESETVEAVEEEQPVKKGNPIKEKIIPAGKGKDKPKKRMFEIMIAENDGPDNGDVFATDPSDGTPFQIQRGQKVRVPEGLVNNLRESVTGKLSYDNEGNEVWKDISRFAMTVYGEVK